MASDGLDVTVVNYRTAGDLRAFLRSFEQFRPTVPHSLTIVNVSPTAEDTAVVAPWLDRPDVRYIEFTTNIGYARAVNRAATVGKREVLAVFNADVVLRPEALDACHEALIAHPEWGVLGPRQIDERGRFTHAGIFGTPEAPEHRGWLERDRGQYQDVREAVTVSGSAYFVRRTTWDELTSCRVYRDFCQAEGAFLPTQHYYEETACSYHARSHAWKVVYFGAATVIHHWHRASPVGGPADQLMRESQGLFRRFCASHAIACD